MSRILLFNLDGKIPSKKNSKQIFRNRKTGTPFITASKKFKDWHPAASLQLNLQMRDIQGVNFPLKSCDEIQITIYYPDQRRRDNSNIVESVHDLLVDVGILEDDNWQVTGKTIQIPVFRKLQAGAEIIIKTNE